MTPKEIEALAYSQKLSIILPRLLLNVPHEQRSKFLDNIIDYCHDAFVNCPLSDQKRSTKLINCAYFALGIKAYHVNFKALAL